MKTAKKNQVMLAMLVGAAILFCVAVLSGCALTPAHAVNAANAENSSISGLMQNTPIDKVNGNENAGSKVGSDTCSHYVDANGDGICDNHVNRNCNLNGANHYQGKAHHFGNKHSANCHYSNGCW